MATGGQSAGRKPLRNDEGRIRRKNMNMDQDKLDRVVEILGAASETEAIERLMDEALLRHELVEGVRRAAGKGGVENYFPDGSFDDWAA
jgi:hypothetical protein